MSNPSWSLIKSFYCLNLDTNPKRWDLCVDVFRSVQIDYVERIITHAEPGDRRYISFNHAHYNAIKKGYETGEPFCIFEDDIEFSRDWKKLEEAVNQLPADWDLFYLGANITGYDNCVWQMPMKMTDNIVRLYNAWMTHAIVYSNKMAKWILENFDPETFPVYDEWLRINAMVPREVYLINPMICYQRPGFSDVSLRQVAYGSHLEGNRWLKENL